MTVGDELHLFDLPPSPPGDTGSVGVGEAPALSATRRLTLRNNTLLAAGRHPATGYPLLGGPFVEGPVQDGPTCGTCSHHVAYGPYGGTRAKWFHKCGLVLATNGPGTDIRISWPACTRWKAAA